MEKWTLTKHKPRDDQVKIINDILSAINEGYKNIILEAGTGTGKALALDTKIPTPTGFTTMADLKVGDEVFDETKERSILTGNIAEECLPRISESLPESFGSSDVLIHYNILLL